MHGLLQAAMDSPAPQLSPFFAVRFDGVLHKMALLAQQRPQEEENRRDILVTFLDIGPVTPASARAGAVERDRPIAAREAAADGAARRGHARRAPSHHRGSARRQRGTAEPQRGIPVHHRGARDQQGGTPEHQRGAAHGQSRAEGQARGGVARAQRSREPDGGEPRRDALPHARPADQAVHAAPRRDLQGQVTGSRSADQRSHAHARLRPRRGRAPRPGDRHSAGPDGAKRGRPSLRRAARARTGPRAGATSTASSSPSSTSPRSSS